MIFDQDISVGTESLLLLGVLGIVALIGLLAITALGLRTIFVLLPIVFDLSGGELPTFKPPIPLILFVAIFDILSELPLGVAKHRVQLPTGYPRPGVGKARQQVSLAEFAGGGWNEDTDTDASRNMTMMNLIQTDEFITFIDRNALLRRSEKGCWWW